jgi:hypothetical protein
MLLINYPKDIYYIIIDFLNCHDIIIFTSSNKEFKKYITDERFLNYIKNKYFFESKLKLNSKLDTQFKKIKPYTFLKYLPSKMYDSFNHYIQNDCFSNIIGEISCSLLYNDKYIDSELINNFKYNLYIKHFGDIARYIEVDEDIDELNILTIHHKCITYKNLKKNTKYELTKEIYSEINGIPVTILMTNLYICVNKMIGVKIYYTFFDINRLRSLENIKEIIIFSPSNKKIIIKNHCLYPEISE